MGRADDQARADDADAESTRRCMDCPGKVRLRQRCALHGPAYCWIAQIGQPAHAASSAAKRALALCHETYTFPLFCGHASRHSPQEEGMTAGWRINSRSTRAAPPMALSSTP